MSKVVAIIQARMSSTRLARKMMLPLKEKPIIEWVVHRVKKSATVDEVVVALPDTDDNNELESLLTNLSVRVVRGDEEDVVSRFVKAADQSEATHIVRVCADNPFVCPKEIDRLVNYYFDQNCDYAYNHVPKNNQYPDGLGAEIVSIEVLRTIDQNAKEQSQREHILNYIWDNPSEFDVQTFDPPDKSWAKPDVRLDIDTQEDYERLSTMDVSMDMDGKDIVLLSEEICQ